MYNDINFEKAYSTLKEKYNITISKPKSYEIYREIRNVIYKYLLIIYQTKTLGAENEGDIFACDESLFNHIKEEQIWVLGTINISKNNLD